MLKNKPLANLSRSQRKDFYMETIKFNVNKLNTSGNKTFTANFSYDVSNGLNYTWGGMQLIIIKQ